MNTSEENQRLDEAIMAYLATQTAPQRAGTIEAATRGAGAGRHPHYRNVNRALQRLRRAGRIRLVKGNGGGWTSAPELPPLDAPAVVIAATSADAEVLQKWQRDGVFNEFTLEASLSRATVVDGAALRAWLEKVRPNVLSGRWNFDESMPAELKALVGGDNG